MPNYFLLALIGPVLWSIVSLLDKYILSRFIEGRGVGVILIVSCLSAIIVTPIVFIFHYKEILSINFDTLIIMLFVGLLAACAFYFYLKAMDTEEASIVVPFFQLMPVFGYVLSYIIIGEQLNPNQIYSCLVVLIGIAIISFEIDENYQFFLKKKLIGLMVSSSFLFALHDTLFKKVAINQTFWVTVFWQYLSIFFFGLLLLVFCKNFRLDTVKMISEAKYKFIYLNVIGEILYIVGNLAHNYASLLAPLTIVLVISSLQPLFVFIIGIFLTLILPSITSEKITTKHIIQKMLALILILLGSYHLYKI